MKVFICFLITLSSAINPLEKLLPIFNFRWMTSKELWDKLETQMYAKYQTQVLKLMQIQQDSIILDLGAGKGYSNVQMVKSVEGF